MRNDHIILLLFLCTFLMLSCQKEENLQTIDPEMLANIDGQDWEASTFVNTLFIGQSQTKEEGKKLDIRAEAEDGSQLILSITDFITGSQGDCLTLGSYYADISKNQCATGNNSTACNGGLATYQLSGTEFYMTEVKEGADGIFTITECDHVNRSISGTFRFKLMDKQSAAVKYEVIEGNFTHLPYRIVR